MNSPFRQIPRAGDDVRNIRSWLTDLARGGGGQSDAMRHSSGLADLRGRPRRLMAGDEPAGSTLLRYVVNSVANDYLNCQLALPNGTPTGDVVKVAKSKNLRYSTWHNRTVGGWSYSVGSGGNTRNVTVNGATGFATGAGYSEEVRPAYAAGDFIYAVEADTGLSVLSEVVTLADVNVDARNWFTTRQQLVGCEWVNNAWVEKRMVVDGGGTY